MLRQRDVALRTEAGDLFQLSGLQAVAQGAKPFQALAGPSLQTGGIFQPAGFELALLAGFRGKHKLDSLDLHQRAQSGNVRAGRFPGGTGRRLEDFRMLWPENGEIVSGGSIASGSDPEKAAVVSGVDIIGGDPGEGVPFEAPDPDPAQRNPASSCATS